MECTRCGREMQEPESSVAFIGMQITWETAGEPFYKVYPELRGYKDKSIAVCFICTLQAFDIPQFRSIPFRR